ASVCMKIKDANGVVIFTLTSKVGTNHSAAIFLRLGTYKVEMSFIPGLVWGSTTNFRLSSYGLTDPIGVVVIDPSTQPDGTTPPPPGTAPPPPTGPTVSWTAGSSGDGSLWF